MHGAALDWKPWTGRPEFKGRGLPKLARVLDVLDCLAIHVLSQKQKASTDDLQDLMRGMYVDVSQGLLRHAHTSSQGVNRALTTSAIVYSYDRDSVLTGRELLQLHGQSQSHRFLTWLVRVWLCHAWPALCGAFICASSFRLDVAFLDSRHRCKEAECFTQLLFFPSSYRQRRA